MRRSREGGGEGEGERGERKRGLMERECDWQIYMTFWCVATGTEKAHEHGSSRGLYRAC